jgi:hypothetical protein
VPDLNSLAGQGNDALDERLRAVQRILEDHYITAMNWLNTVDNPVDENCFVIGEQRSHAVALNCYRLINKDKIMIGVTEQAINRVQMRALCGKEWLPSIYERLALGGMLRCRNNDSFFDRGDRRMKRYRACPIQCNHSCG